MRRLGCWLLVGAAALVPCQLAAQSAASTRLAILLAEERRAPTAVDLAVIRGGVRSFDTDTALMAIRALGRLERPALVPDIAPALRSNLPELRAEAANAIAAAFGRGNQSASPSPRAEIASALNTLSAGVDIDDAPEVRAAICEAIGRLPYVDRDQVAQAEKVLIGASERYGTVTDQLGVARGLEALIRTNRSRRPPSAAAVDTLLRLFGMSGTTTVAASGGRTSRTDADLTGGARVRRLAFQGLLDAGDVSGVVERAAADRDPQVRRLAMLGASSLDRQDSDRDVAAILQKGLSDPAPMVRIEALKGENVLGPGGQEACALAVDAARDPEIHVALAAIDALAACGTSADAVSFLERTVNETSPLESPRGWHRLAHALVALAGAAPASARARLGELAGSPFSTVRLSAARAAGVLKDRDVLNRLASDADSQVADQARAAIVSPAPPSAPERKPPPSALTAPDLRRLAAARARITVQDAGTFEVALFTAEAPATVLRFARLAESGYYNGLTIDQELPNLVVRPRSAPGDEPLADAVFPRDELGSWPNVRGALALSSDPRHADAGRIVIELVDNPEFDHQYTVFAQVLNGLDVVDALLEGDVIERVEILP